MARSRFVFQCMSVSHRIGPLIFRTVEILHVLPLAGFMSLLPDHPSHKAHKREQCNVQHVPSSYHLVSP